MCGIIGVLGKSLVLQKLMNSLQTLEYRGYDSAGVALLFQNAFKLVRAAGKLQNLQNKLTTEDSLSGIGHTRWATHGGATEENAHPHIAGDVVVVHNGIIENYAELKNELQDLDIEFKSETDTEVICQLINHYYSQNQNKIESLQKALHRFRGSYAFLVAFKDEPSELFAVCSGSPLVVGKRTIDEKQEFFVASDALAIAPWVQQLYYMQNKEIAQLNSKLQSVKLFNFSLEEQKIPFEENRLNAATCSKQGYPHYMLKEIFEQPNAIAESILATTNLFQQKKEQVKQFFNQHITLIACGTSYHACIVGKYFLEKYARVKCDCELASEFLYRDPVLEGGYVFISQSGETRDTLAAFEMIKKTRQSLSIVNVPTSQLARNTDITFVTQAGFEIGVASTKAFTAQISVLLQIVSLISNHSEITSALSAASFNMKSFMKFVDCSIKNLATSLFEFKNVMYLGRGPSYPIALEGALKMKELCYIHAEGFAAGELKHGPIALIDDKIPIIVFVSENTLEKMMNNVQEVSARFGCLIIVCSQSCKQKFENQFSPRSSKLNSLQQSPEGVLQKIQFIEHPNSSEVGEILYQSVIQQLLAYHTAVNLGVDVDQPRNLAKCVTVE